MAEAFGIGCHEWVSLDFRCGSRLCKNSCCFARVMGLLGLDGLSRRLFGFVDLFGSRGFKGRVLPF